MSPSPLRLVKEDEYDQRFVESALKAIEHKQNVQRQLMGLPVRTFEQELRRRYIQGQIEIEEFELGLDMLYGLKKAPGKVDWMNDADES